MYIYIYIYDLLFLYIENKIIAKFNTFIYNFQGLKEH